MKSRLLFVGLVRTVSAFASSSASSKGSLMGTSSSSSSRFTKSLAKPDSAIFASRSVLSSRGNHLRHVSSSLSSTANGYSTSSSSSYYDHDPPHNYHDDDNDDLQPLPPPPLTLRLARRTDILSMQKCNLATLPENYNEQFYASHLQQWPELALVVVMPRPRQRGSQQHDRYAAASRWTGGPLASSSSSSTEQVVAYVLGKLEDRPLALEDALERYQDDFDDDYVYNNNNNINLRPQQDTQWYDGGSSSSRNTHHRQQPRIVTTPSTITYGHVTSLAVLKDFRRQGLARELMQQLHAHLAWHYGHRTSRVGLHVRAGNVGATRLYQQAFGYQVMERIAQYYQDGEDGLLMEMDLLQQPARQVAADSQSSKFLTSLWGRTTSSWKSRTETLVYDDRPEAAAAGVDLSLPRHVGLVPQTYQERHRRQDELEEPIHMSY